MKKGVYTGLSRTTLWRKAKSGVLQSLLSDFDEIPEFDNNVSEDSDDIASKRSRIISDDALPGIATAEDLNDSLSSSTSVYQEQKDQETSRSPDMQEQAEHDDDSCYYDKFEEVQDENQVNFDDNCEKFFVDVESDVGSDGEWSDDDEINTEHANSDDFPSHNTNNDDKIYEGSNISVKESALMLITFFVQFKLSYACMSKVIALVIAHLPPNNKVLRSMYIVRKFLAGKEAHFKKHFYCSKCKKPILVGSICNELGCEDSKPFKFLIFPIEEQLCNLFQRSSFREMLEKRKSRTKLHADNLEDIYDGSLYKRFNSFLSCPFNLSLAYYTDGVEIFKSAKSSVWPTFFSINELPYDKRYLPENIIFGGLWYGGTKPDFNIFFRPLYDSFVKLRNGLSIMVKSLNNKIFFVQCIVLNGIADMPAKAMLLNMKSFNGFFGCPKCLIQGKSLHLGGRSRVFVYPYMEPLTLRDSESTNKFAAMAKMQPKHVYNGIKGTSIISRIVPDFIRSLGVDMMHALCSGAGGKRLMELWFSRQFKSFSFSLFNQVTEIDKKLTSLQPPNYIKRAPRPIETHLKLYKSSEFKNWFFYFSIPILYGIMPLEQLQHYFLLVHAFFLLSQNSISLVDIEKARELIRKFVKEFETLYGERFMSANIHSLLHMADNVLELGPLFVTSCFPLEDLNGKMKSLVCGSRYAEVKIAESFYTLQNLPKYVSQLKENSLALNFIHNIKSNNLLLLERIDEASFTIGKYTLLNNIPYVIQEAFSRISFSLQNSTCRLFHRLHKNRVLYIAHGYTRLNKSISYCIEYDDNKIGLLESFVKVTKCTCNNNNNCVCPAFFFCIVNQCFWVEINGIGENKFINELLPTDSFIAVPHTNLVGLCVLSKVNDLLFCAKRVNNIEME